MGATTRLRMDRMSSLRRAVWQNNTRARSYYDEHLRLEARRVGWSDQQARRSGSDDASGRACPDRSAHRFFRQSAFSGTAPADDAGSVPADPGRRLGASRLPRTTDWSFDYNAALVRQAEDLGFDIVFWLSKWLPKGGYGDRREMRADNKPENKCGKRHQHP